MPTKGQALAALGTMTAIVAAMAWPYPGTLRLSDFDDPPVLDATNYKKAGSPYLGFSSDYNPGGLTRGKDYFNKIYVTSAQFPNRTRFRGSWPAWTGGVRGYMHLSRGNYDGGAPSVSTPSKRVSALTTFTETVAWYNFGSNPYFNVLEEFYLTSTSGNPNTKTAEIGFFLHAPPSTLSYLNVGESKIVNGVEVGHPNINYGNYTSNIDGSIWVCRSLYNPSKPAARYITFVQKVGNTVGVDYASGVTKTFDKKHVLQWLIGKGAITGNEFINGAAIGIEPTFEGGVYDVYFHEWSAVWN